ncbi:MAG TPA: hypothetical protein VL918_01875 [Sphingobium sp.]|nr:hypothetical protein [Sphingobium sp.]
MPKTLTHFSIRDHEGGYMLEFQDEEGATTEFQASYEQLDLIVDEINTQLDEDEEEELGIDEDDE